MKRNSISNSILAIILVVSSLTGLIFIEFSGRYVENNYNSKSDIISDLRYAPGDWNAPITLSVGHSPDSIFIGDANNDGDNDIITANGNAATVSILLWNGTSSNWDPQITRAVGNFPMGVFIGDTNNDGDNDIVTANVGSNIVSILLWNSTSGDWNPRITRTVGNAPNNVFIGDTNNDGDNDIITTNGNADTVSILLWNSTSSNWDPQITRTVGDSPVRVFIGDANNDGDNDIATANYDSGTVSILLWNSTAGDWNIPITRTVGDYPFGVFIEDANNDGDNDIVASSSSSDTVSILLWNSTAGDWNTPITRTVGDYPYGVFIGDANNDGDNDIVNANKDSDTVSILLWNSTAGNWDSPITRTVGDSPCRVFIGDANNDGDNDIATANFDSNTVSILLWEEEIYLNLISPENETYIEPISGYYPASYGFENDIDGIVAKDWWGLATVESSYDGHNKVIKHTTYGWNPIGVNFNNQTSGSIEFYFNTNDNDKDIQFNCFGYTPIGGTSRPIILGVESGNFQRYESGWDDLDIPTSCSVDTWYHICIDFNCDTDTWNTTINGELKSWDDPFDAGNSICISDLRFYQFQSPVTTRFDAIGFSWDPNYNIGDDLNEGLFISYETNLTPDWVGYSLDRQVNKTISGNTTIPFPNDGLHTIQIYGNNSLGTMYQSEFRFFLVDTILPKINIVSPSQDDFFGITPPDFQISFTELNIDSMWYYLGVGTNEVIFSGLTGTINQTEWNKLGEGPVTMRFYINDTGGLENFDEIVIQKDLTPPISSISYTLYKTPNIVNTSTTFSLSANDGIGSGVDILRFKINNTMWFEYTDSFTLSEYDYGYYLITYQAIDVVGNIEAENTILVLLVKTPSKEAAIHGFNTFLIMSIIGLTTLILIKKYKK
jgi:hypothetical protein